MPHTLQAGGFFAKDVHRIQQQQKSLLSIKKKNQAHMTSDGGENNTNMEVKASNAETTQNRRYSDTQKDDMKSFPSPASSQDWGSVMRPGVPFYSYNSRWKKTQPFLHSGVKRYSDHLLIC